MLRPVWSREITNALMSYFIREFDSEPMDAYESAHHTVIGLAYTELYDEEEERVGSDNFHPMQAELHRPQREIVYYIDEEEVGKEKFDDDRELASFLKDVCFEDFYSRALQFAPESYH